MKVVGVCSVKGGVGKSLIAVNLAYHLSKIGETALIDADIDSSNLAEFIGDIGRIPVTPDKTFIPLEWKGIKVWSMSLVTEKWRPVSLTGDKYVSILKDVYENSEWGDLDYLVLDLPSGSHDSWRGAIDLFAYEYAGDIVVVQPAFPDNTRRVLELHRVNDIPIIGVIENMSYFVCPHHKKPKIYKIFGEGVAEKLSEQYGTPFLGKIPIIPDLQERIRLGNPILEEYSHIFRKACEIIREIPEEKVGIVRRIKEKIAEIGTESVMKILSHILVTVNTEIGLPENVYYDERMVASLVIVTPDWRRALARMNIRVKDGKLVYVKKPSKIDFEIHMPFKTLARVVMGKRRLRNGDVIPYDAWDAYLNNDLEVYSPTGASIMQRAVDIIRGVLNPEVMERAREKFPFLEKFI